MKNRGHGQAKVLNPSEISRLFLELKKKPRDAALFAICLFTGCRISEALQLETTDFIENHIIFRKSTTKGKLKTRTVPIHPGLKPFLEVYQPKKPGLMFPAHWGENPIMSRHSADRILRRSCRRAGIVGVSTHSFRRTALTYMNRSGVPLRTIQELSGHKDLGSLQKYLEVDPDELVSAIGLLPF